MSSDHSYAEILPGLFIGDKQFAANYDVLQSLGITHIINATIDIRHYYENNEMMKYLRCAW